MFLVICLNSLNLTFCIKQLINKVSYSFTHQKLIQTKLFCIAYLFFKHNNTRSSSTMSLGTVDYQSSYFKYKTPTPIRGVPTYTALKRLKTELQANASSIETDIGGGNHGYLALVLTDEEYNSIPNTEPFVLPTYPALLVIPPTATAIEAMQMKEEYNDGRRRYLECKNYEKALLRYIHDALEEKYVAALVDNYTNLITTDIPETLQCLFYNFGKVSSEEVAQKESEVMAMTWLPSDPIILLTKPLEDLNKLANQAGVPFTPAQILEKALSVIRATRDFELALAAWEDKPQEEKTWDILKTHFHDAQQQLKSIRGPSMQQAGCHQANALAQRISEDIKLQFNERDTQMLAMLQAIPSLTSSSTDSDDSQENELTPQYVSNVAANVASSGDNVQLEILRILKELSVDIKSSRPVPYQDRGGQDFRRQTRKTPNEGGKMRKNISQYCWTHGACAHSSDSCPNKVKGHKSEATFQDKMNGSLARCE